MCPPGSSKGDKGGGKHGGPTTVAGKVAPIAQSHQRQLSLKASEIQERLIKNKSLLNVVEPTLENTPLEVLLGILQQRIELDKECLFQFTQIKKDMKLDGGGEKGAGAGGKAKSSQGGSGHSVAPVLMRYQRGCQQVGHELPSQVICFWLSRTRSSLSKEICRASAAKKLRLIILRVKPTSLTLCSMCKIETEKLASWRVRSSPPVQLGRTNEAPSSSFQLGNLQIGEFRAALICSVPASLTLSLSLCLENCSGIFASYHGA